MRLCWDWEWRTVGDIQADGRYAGHGGKRDGAAQARQRQDEVERTCEPDYMLSVFRISNSGRLNNNAPVRTGDLRFASTLWKNVCPGMPPSRAKAYIIRLFEVMEKVPQKNIAPITMT